MNTQKLKELARRATGGIWNAFINEKTNTFSIHTPDDARCGNIVDWMGFDGVDCSKKQKAHNARFIAASNPAAVIDLIEGLEAAERERNELRAEIARRDAAAGEPVAWRYAFLPSVGDESGWKYVESEDLCNGSSGYVAQPLYTAAPPAASGSDGWLLIPAIPSQSHLNSIAMRYRHDFYLLPDNQRESVLSTARQMYEECSGQGFYSIPKPAAPAPGGDGG